MHEGLAVFICVYFQAACWDRRQHNASAHWVVLVQQYWVKEGPHSYVPVAAFVEQFRRSPPGKVPLAQSSGAMNR